MRRYRLEGRKYRSAGAKSPVPSIAGPNALDAELSEVSCQMLGAEAIPDRSCLEDGGILEPQKRGPL
jgi:hypothetical protein